MGDWSMIGVRNFPSYKTRATGNMLEINAVFFKLFETYF